MPTLRNNIGRLIGNKEFNISKANASLWLDKFIFDSTKDGKSSRSRNETAKAELVEKVTSIKESSIYKNYFYQTWKKQLDNFSAKYRYAKVKNRLAINLGSETVLETNIALHRVFGVPFIAGSSLKGMTAAFIRQYGGTDWQKNKDFYITVFGDENNAGFITFYDALYVPKTGYDRKPLYADVMTPHHQEYYGGGNAPPADWDNPNPVPFISATGEYLIALSAPTGCGDWLELGFDVLGFALAVEGIGAKTSSGYGRMWLENETRQPNDGEDRKYGDKYEIEVSVQTSSSANSAEQSTPISQSDIIAEGFIRRINALRNTDVAGQIPVVAQDCLKIEDKTAKKQVAQAIITKVDEVGRTKKSMGKPWYQKIASLGEGAEWIIKE
jgi:CRISPR-associated protein Cmr6